MSKVIKPGVRILCFFLVLYFLLRGLAVFSTEFFKAYRQHNRALWQEVYHTDENYEYLFVGSSQVYNGVNPFIFQEETGLVTCDLTSSQQELWDAYYMIREAMKYHDVKYVTMNIAYSKYNQESVSRRGSRSTFDYLRPSVNKAQFVQKTMGHPAVLDPAYAVAEEQDSILEGIPSKSQHRRMLKRENWTELYQGITESHAGKGYVEGKGMREGAIVVSPEQWRWNENSLSSDRISGLRAIIEMCQKEGVEVNLVGVPLHPAYVMNSQSYQAAFDYFTAMAAGYGIPFWDFNMVKGEHLTLDPVDDFEDTLHLNVNGATAFTEAFSAFWQENEAGVDTSGWFYTSWADKEAEYTDVQGLQFFTDWDAAVGMVQSSECIPLSSRPRSYEFYFEAAMYANEEEDILEDVCAAQEWSSNAAFAWTPPAGGSYRVTMEVREAGSTAVLATAYRDVTVPL